METSERVYAVIDTNVLVSALLSSVSFSNPFIILESIFNGVVIPLYDERIMEEYRNVLSRPKFHFNENQVETVLQFIKEYGIEISAPNISNVYFPDPKDICFYEVKMSIEDSYLVTGNIKHFPIKPFIITPLQMVELLKAKGLLP